MASTPDPQFRPPSAASRRVADFWAWWRAEILRMLPGHLGAMRGGGVPLVFVEGDEAVVVDAQTGTEKRVNVAGLDENARRTAVRALIEGTGETRGRARAALARDEALVRRVNLPAATEENLNQVVAFEMDRLSPFKADEVYFDQRVISRDATNSQIGVELALARREIVDERVRQVRSLGANVQGVALRDDAPRGGVPAFDLLPSEQRGERETPQERLLRNALIAAVVLLFVAALALPVYQKRETVVSLLPAVEKARVEATAADAVVRDLERQATDYNFLLARRHAWHPTALYLEEISKVMPDHTWLQQLDVKSSGKTKELTITGETASASKLIELMETSRVLQNAAPRGPTTRGSTPGSERFMIAAELRPRPAPEPQPISAQPRPFAPAQPAAAPAGPAAPTATLQPVPAPPTPPAAAARKAQPTPQTEPAPPASGFGPFPPKQ